MEIQDVIRVYEKMKRASDAAIRAAQEYNVCALDFMTELASNLPDTLAEEMLLYVSNADARLDADVWIVTLNLEDWCIAGLRKIAVFDPVTAEPEVER